MTVKKFLILALATFSAPALAAEGASPPVRFFKSGFQAGLSAGYSFGKADIQTVMSVANQNDTVKGSASKGGFVGGMSMGYQHLSAKGVIIGGALELSFDTGKLSKSFNAPNLSITSQTSLQRSFAITPVFVVGMKVAEKLLVLGQLGPSFAWFKGDHVETLNRTGAQIKESFKERKLGISLGAKVVYALIPAVSISVGVDYVHYGKMNQKFKPYTQNGVHVAPQTHTGSCSYSAITPKLGMTYQF